MLYYCFSAYCSLYRAIAINMEQMLNQHKKAIFKGNTTQSEILEIFGAPNLVSKNKSNNEVWSYNKMSVVNKQGGTDFLFGARASQSSSTQSFDLIITFDSNDIVSDYSVISTSY